MKLIIIGFVMVGALTGMLCTGESFCCGVPAAIIAEIIFFIVYVSSFRYLDRHRQEFEREIDKLFGEEK